ncbi:HNH endonuclease [Sphingomonas sp. PP-F2F-A104-K0414]|uniref:HNH endonuclease n=1 Tax=Sphingomonas sp. PP-F2F-A104-K0414 TaxID=2135661 RepID=UPI001404CEAB|nr:HNH endonuclease [Sphingomonas sp. PP-F2F-A104-K0414]
MLAIAGPRQHGGNTGYLDSPKSVYRFDSGVANSGKVKRGDLVFIRDRDGLLGVSVIDHISSKPGEKVLLKCPECGKAKIRKRAGQTPAYRCESGHVFDKPAQSLREVVLYEAFYEKEFILASGAVTGKRLRAAAWRPNLQLSIEEVDASRIAEDVIEAAPQARYLLQNFFQSMAPESVAQDDDKGYMPQLGDRRQKVLATIARRRGQAKFRTSLIKRYGPRCALSGCTVMAIVEAAHIWPYRGEEDNHVQNGLLLRADLHTLYDLDLIGIDPRFILHVADDLKNSEYAHLSGLQIDLCAKPSRTAIESRWNYFKKNS